MVNSYGVVNVGFEQVPSGLYWLLIRHGSHLTAVSANPIQITFGVATPLYDFSIPGSSLGNVAKIINGKAVIKKW